MGGISAAVLATIKPAAAAVAPLKDRTLHLYHRQTGEFFKETYFQDGFYVVDALDRVNWLMRDWRTDETKTIDPGLLDLLYNVGNNVDAAKPFEILSGYRTLKPTPRFAVMASERRRTATTWSDRRSISRCRASACATCGKLLWRSGRAVSAITRTRASSTSIPATSASGTVADPRRAGFYRRIPFGPECFLVVS